MLCTFCRELIMRPDNQKDTGNFTKFLLQKFFVQKFREIAQQNDRKWDRSDSDTYIYSFIVYIFVMYDWESCCTNFLNNIILLLLLLQPFLHFKNLESELGFFLHFLAKKMKKSLVQFALHKQFMGLFCHNEQINAEKSPFWQYHIEV